MTQTISQKQLVRLFKDTKDNTKSDLRFCFLLGAGASRSSGIKTGAEMAKLWYENIKEDLTVDELETWKKSIGLDEERVADFYPKVFEKRFIERRAGYEFLQCEMDKAEPSLGYAVLAQVLEETKHNFVITTNFDYLIEDALQSFTHTHPLVCGHESLASFVYTHSERPTIMKVHRDLFLDPFNDGDNVSRLKQEWVEALKPIVSNFHIVVLGYGGNDGSLMDYLTEIPAENRKAIYWCVRDPKSLNEKITQLLGSNDKIVQIKGFDELMYELHSVYEFEKYVDGNDLEKSKIVEVARERAKRFKAKIDELGRNIEERSKAGEEVSKAEKEMLSSWWEYQLKVNDQSDPEKKNEIFIDGLKVFPNETGLVGNYANFLKNVRKDYDEAEKYYKRALDLDPNYVNNNGNYALFLKNIRKDYDEAEKYFKQALDLDPNHAAFHGNYALFLNDTRKDYDEAEKHYKRALDLDPNHVIFNGNYALFLKNIRKDYDEAEKYFKQALDLDPNDADNNGNYALFLYDIRKDYDEAEKYFKRALDLDPNDADNNGNYALFLKNIRKDYDEAEKHYKRALDLDPNHVIFNGNYALFLNDIREDYDEAEKYYKRALDLDPNDANNNANYALFLYDIRKDYDEAEKYFKRALDLDPNHEAFNGNYAIFLNDIRKDYDEAEKYFKRALDLDPNDANNNTNYVGFLLAQGKKNESLPYLQKAFENLIHNDLKLELTFYLMAHFPEKYEEAKQTIEALLAEGAQSKGWDFSQNISRAEQDGCKYINELKELAEKITGIKH